MVYHVPVSVGVFVRAQDFFLFLPPFPSLLWQFFETDCPATPFFSNNSIDFPSPGKFCRSSKCDEKNLPGSAMVFKAWPIGNHDALELARKKRGRKSFFQRRNVQPQVNKTRNETDQIRSDHPIGNASLLQSRSIQSSG